MGRYAFFHVLPQNEEKAIASGFDTCHEQKFWFSVQDSEIPFATNTLAQTLREQDEDAANEAKQTEKQKAFWKKQEDRTQTESEVTHFSEAIQELLEKEASQEGQAELTDEHLEEYLEVTWELAEELGKPKIDVKGLKDWVEFQHASEPITNTPKQKPDGMTEVRLAELYLMQKVCILLAKWGGFTVNFEY